MRWLGILLVTGVLVSACILTPWRVNYLTEATGHATQDDVAQSLGPPHLTQTLDSGQIVWLYKYPGAIGGDSYCRQYILTFDTQRILRSWVRQNC